MRRRSQVDKATNAPWPMASSLSDLSQPLCWSTRIYSPPNRYGFSHSSLRAFLSSISIPNTYCQAIKHECWQKVMKEEINALQTYHTWGIVPCPLSAKPIGCKCIYFFKPKFYGSLDRYKARLVTLGNRQEYALTMMWPLYLLPKFYMINKVLTGTATIPY